MRSQFEFDEPAAHGQTAATVAKQLSCQKSVPFVLPPRWWRHAGMRLTASTQIYNIYIYAMWVRVGALATGMRCGISFVTMCQSARLHASVCLCRLRVTDVVIKSLDASAAQPRRTRSGWQERWQRDAYAFGAPKQCALHSLHATNTHRRTHRWSYTM